MRVLALGVALGLPAAALSHHGWSEYDTGRPLALSGKIVEAGYEHPHGYVRLESPGKTWHVVLAPPSRMERRGLPREALQAGGTVSVEGYPNRDKAEEMRAERISLGGKTIELR
jgi:hypothetical protein